METIHLYRRRYMPDETVELKDDLILYRDDNILVTKWNILKPRKDIDHGISVYYMKDGFKISKVFDANDKLVYWYCDIIETEYRPEENTYIFHDLLIDVLIYPDKHVEVVDLDEFADFTENLTLPLGCRLRGSLCRNHVLGVWRQRELQVLRQVDKVG